MPVSPVITPSPNVGTHGYITIVDVQGYPIGTVAASDGAEFRSISGESLFLFNNGGPPDVTGLPTGNSFDRARGYLGKNSVAEAITPTSIGDAAITFTVAPKTLMPGHAIKLTGGTQIEYVYIDPTFIPTVSTTVFPLVDPVVYAGQNFAVYDQFDPNGPVNLPFNPVGIGLTGIALAHATPSIMTAARSATSDNQNAQGYLEVVAGGMTSDTTVDRLRTPNVFKPLNALAVTAAASNTPSLIWTPASGKKFRLMGYWLSTTNAAGLLFHDLVATGGTGLLNIPSPIHAAGAVIESPPLGNGVISGVANNKLWIDATAATTLTGFVWGTEEA